MNRRNTRQNLNGLFALILTGWLIGCAANPTPVTAPPLPLSVAQEQAIGDSHFALAQQNAGGLAHIDPDLSAYVDRIGQELAAVGPRPDLDWQFVVINSPIPDTWSLPGGKVAISRALLFPLSNEAELAALLAHEIGHVNARHGVAALQSGALVKAGAGRLGIALPDRAMSALIPGVPTLGLALAQYNTR